MTATSPDRLARQWVEQGQALAGRGQLLAAGALTRRALRLCPEVAAFWVALASIQCRLLRPESALTSYHRAEALDANFPLLHLSIGHVLKTLGRRAECERVYRECLERDPASGDAFWSLADLKDYRFDDADLRTMQRAIDSGAGGSANEARLHFALGRAYELRGEVDRSFEHYAAGNSLRHAERPFDIVSFDAKCARVMHQFDKAFFDHVAGQGCAAPDPVFIVGLPRSGSTLVEQILATHPAIEGTMELPNVPQLVSAFDRMGAGLDAYPESAASAPTGLWRRLGERYLADTRSLRRGRPFFIDKLPNNFLHIGLIHAMLPNAIIIDVSRNPMDACFSCFKQHFAMGQRFTYDLGTLGRYYRQYLQMMSHWDQVLPGRVLHVAYETLIERPEATVRTVLAHCKLPFDPRCLEFHRNERPVRTASSEQVRKPLYSAGIGQYRAYERHLGPLRDALGSCLASECIEGSRAAVRARTDRRILPRAARVTVAAAVAGSLAAQSVQADASADVLQEIVVTARKRVERLQDVPQNIDVLTDRDVRERNVVRIEDIATLVPSMSYLSNGPTGQRVVIRGASDGSQPNYGTGFLSTTAYLIDDLSLGFYGHDPDLHLYDIERIEVLNGPQGTLSGPSALAGAVRIVTHKPDPNAFSLGVDVEGSQIDRGANNGTYEGFLNVPLIGGRTALRLSAYTVREGGYIDNVPATRQWLNGTVSTNADWAGRNQNTRDLVGGRIALQHAFSDDWLVRLTGYYQQQQFRGSFEEDPTNVGARQLRRFSPQGGFQYGRFVELHLEGRTPFGDLVYAGGYLREDTQRLYDFSDYAQYSPYASSVNAATCANAPPPYGTGYQGCKVPYMYGSPGGEIERYSNELRLQSHDEGPTHWTVGVYWEKTLDPGDGFEHLPNIDFSGAFAQYAISYYGGHATPLPEEYYSAYSSYQTHQWSEFGNLSYAITPRVQLEAGIQHFTVESTEHDYWAGYFFNSKTSSDHFSASHKTNFKAGISYKPKSNTLLYATFAQGFRQGEFNYPSDGKHFIPASSGPDTLNSVEIGLKWQGFGGHLGWDSAVYDMRWKDYQVGIGVPYPPYGFSANIGDVRIWGAETSLAWRPIEGLEARWNGNFNASTLLSNAFQQPSFQVMPGERLPESATLNWSASLRYEHAVGSSWRAFGQFDASHKGGIWNSLKLDARSFQAPYTLANLRAGLTRADGALSIEAFVTNIANTRGVVFFNSTGYDYYPGVSTPEIDTPPRTIGLRLHMGWDRKR